jgi:hypothetical protein
MLNASHTDRKTPIIVGVTRSLGSVLPKTRLPAHAR